MALFKYADNLAIISALSDGQTGVYTPASGPSNSALSVEFQSAYSAGEVFGLKIEAARPVAYAATSDLNGTEPRGGTLAISGTTYNILTPQPDSEGMTLLVLEEA